MSISLANDTYLTEAEAAERLGVTTRTMIRWRSLRSGPPHCRVGARTLYREGAIAAWLTRQEQRQGRAAA